LAADRLPLRIALATGATLAALLVGEAASRLLLPPPRYHREPVELDPELGFRGIPHFRRVYRDERGEYEFALNSQGLRGRELPGSPAREGSRIAFVGDSFLVAQAVRDGELVTSRVEAALRAQGREVDVYNLSAVDYGTSQELLLFRRLGRPLEPAAVVLFLYPANDLANDSIALAGRTGVSPGDPLRPYLVPGAGGRLELRHLQPARALFRRSSRLFAALERALLALSGTGPRGEDSVGRLRQGRAPREDLELFRSHAPGDPWEEAFETSFALLRAFRAECDAIGARLLVVVVPSVHQVARTAKGIRFDLAARVAGGEGIDAVLDWSLPERRLAGFFASEGIDARFLLRVLRDAEAAGERVYTRDEHLSARGHEIAADAVMRWLTGAPAGEAAGPPGAGRPVRRLGAAAEPRFLDFRAGPHLDHLGDGWLSWAPPGSGAPAGWLVGTSALAVLPIGEGELVLVGSALEGARYPIAGAVEFLGGESHRFEIRRPGRFALRFPARAGADAPPTSEGYLVLTLAPDPGADAGGLRIEGLGFPLPDAAWRRGGDRPQRRVSAARPARGAA
jgi:hypothetical protein